MNFQNFQTMFFVAGFMYLLYLAILVLKSYSELRSMPYFGNYDFTLRNICKRSSINIFCRYASQVFKHFDVICHVNYNDGDYRTFWFWRS